ncbi:MAG: hypothetical protein AAF581_13550 [Planctomycetota bacterium]
MNTFRSSIPLAVACATNLLVCGWLVAGPVLLEFENSGPESGITTPGATAFAFQGSNWSGGMVASVGNGALYSSGFFSYMSGTAGQVIFDEPVDSVAFFYVHNGAVGAVTAYGQNGAVVATAASNPATFFADPANFVTLDPIAPIRRLEFSGGVVDSFASSCYAPAQNEILFDNSGSETGVTTPGTSDFAFLGSNWSGGTVATAMNPPLYASGAFSYMSGMSGQVVFDGSATLARFFYVSATPATATAYAADGSVLATVEAGPPTVFAAPENFRILVAAQPMQRIEFAGGVIDSFSFDPGPSQQPQFRRGDVDDNSSVNLSDPIVLLGYLFQMGAAPACPDAADANDDGSINLTDVIHILLYLHSNGMAPAAPGPDSCGVDTTADSLGFCATTHCP